MEMFEYAFMQRAFIVGVLLALIIPLIGVTVVLRRLSMLGDALSHTSLAGVAAGLLLNVNPVFGASVFCVGAAFGIGAAVDVREISVDSGLIDAVSLILGADGGVLVGVVALLFLVTLFGNMISWSMGVNSTAALAADHNDMPRVFAKRWAKNNMPVGSAVASGVVASGVCILGVLIEMVTPDSSLFWSFFALNLVMLLLSYLPVFPAFLKLRREDAKTPRPFRVPGSDAALRCIAYVPMALIIISIIFTAVPLSFDAETLKSFLPITIGTILSAAIGEVLIALRGKTARS